jgi:hypothetical protein
MLPDLNYMPAEEILYLKRDELMREFRDIRLIAAASEATPSFAQRLRARIAQLFHVRPRVTVPRQSYIDSAIRLAA